MATTKVDVNLIGATGTPGSGNFLRGDGTWSTPAAGAMTFINTTDISSAATYNFTAVDASSYDGYGFFLQNIVPVTDDVKFNGRTSTDGGSSYDTSGYSWVAENWGAYTTSKSDGEIEFLGSTAATSYRVGSAADEPGVSGWIWLIGPHLTGYTMINSSLSGWSADDYTVCFDCAASRTSAANVDAFQLYFSSGNIESGTINSYGLANS